MQNLKAATVAEYLAALPAERRAVIEAVRKVFLSNLGEGYQEGMQYGMIGYFIPHSLYPAGYHCDPKQPLPFAGLAAQKNHYGLYLMCLYGSPQHLAWFQKAWTGAGKKLDMGKACVRFKKLEDVPLDVLGEAIRRVPVSEAIAVYERGIQTMNKAASARRSKEVTKQKSTTAAGKRSSKVASKQPAPGNRKAEAGKAAKRKPATKKQAGKKQAGKKLAGKKRAGKKKSR